MAEKKVSICFLGGTRYDRPLNSTHRKKFQLLAPLGRLYVIAFGRGLRPGVFQEEARFYLIPDWPVSGLRYLSIWILGFFLVVWLALNQRVRVVVAQCPFTALGGAMAKTVLKYAGVSIALIVENHGDFEESLFLQRHIRLKRVHRLAMRVVAGFSLARADALRAVSASTAAQLHRWKPETAIEVFPTWTDLDVFFAAGEAAEKRLVRDPPRILFVGVLTPLKGVDVLVEAFGLVAARFPGAVLAILGEAVDRQLAAALQRRVAELGLTDRVEFGGFLPQAELARRMTDSSVFVLPSFSEGLPRVVIEAMACGRPVVASAVGGITELVRDGVTGLLVPPGDAQALAERLRWLLENPAEARKMGMAGREIALQLFSADKYVAGFERLIRKARGKAGLC